MCQKESMVMLLILIDNPSNKEVISITTFLLEGILGCRIHKSFV
jgi:hypothetical protein